MTCQPPDFVPTAKCTSHTYFTTLSKSCWKASPTARVATAPVPVPTSRTIARLDRFKISTSDHFTLRAAQDRYGDITKDGARFVFKDGTERRHSVIADNRVLYVVNGHGMSSENALYARR